jgi:threonine aldolase
MTVVDLRSDTVTRPTPAMRKTMAEAEVGDDVYGDDPTVRRLEETTAALLNKEAAVFVPSGTMANQIALSLLAGPGTEVIIEQNAHILNYEAGAASAFWGITLRPLGGDRGRLSPGQIQAQLRPEDEHIAPIRAVALENTHNRAAGAVWSPEALAAVYEAASAWGLGVHLDGARLWNAAAATGVEPAKLARGADTVSVCFSKGLGAPVGSVVASTRLRIARARVHRKRLGGGMRQVGIVAAGALYALDHHRERLPEDHRRARTLGESLAGFEGVTVYPVETNMVIADIRETGRDPGELVENIAGHGVLVGNIDGGQIRAVTHLDIDDADVARAVEAFESVLGAGR